MPGRNSLWVRHPFDLCGVQSADRFRWRPAGCCGGQGLAPSDVTEDLGNQRWILDAGDDPEFPPTLWTDFYCGSTGEFSHSLGQERSFANHFRFGDVGSVGASKGSTLLTLI